MMASRNGRELERLSLRELVDLQGKVERALTVVKETERNALKQKVAALAESHGFSVGELFGAGARKTIGYKKPTGVAKYVNPDNRAQTWTGRGRRPYWLDDQLKAGRSLSEFEI